MCFGQESEALLVDSEAALHDGKVKRKRVHNWYLNSYLQSTALLPDKKQHKSNTLKGFIAATYKLLPQILPPATRPAPHGIANTPKHNAA